MKITIAAAALLALAVTPITAEAKQSPYPPGDQFSGDRYVARQAQGASGSDVTRAMGCPPPACQRVGKPRYLYPTRKRPPVTRQRWKRVPVPMPRPVTTGEYRADTGPAEPMTVFEGMRREAGRAAAKIVGGRPSGCPHAYCGCGASIHLFGRIIPSLNLAANWLRFPRAAPAPKMAAARHGHVFVLEQHIRGNVWMVFDANSGRGHSRIHPRSIAGFTIVNPHGRRTT